MYRNGDVYTGSWVKGLKDGEGEMIFSNKSSFKGQFKKDQFHRGVYKDETGNMFKTLKHSETNPKLDGQFKKGRLFGFVSILVKINYFIGQDRVY